MTARTPIAKFLGESAEVAGPFSLLDIAPAEASPKRVEAALQRRLDEIDQHPQAYSPEADEVRLALHTAAAQLLDPNVRRELLRRFAIDEPAQASPARSNDAEREFFDLADAPARLSAAQPPLATPTRSAPIVIERPSAEADSPSRNVPSESAGEFLSRGEWSEYTTPTKAGKGLLIASIVAGGVLVVVVAIVAILASNPKSAATGASSASKPASAAPDPQSPGDSSPTAEPAQPAQTSSAHSSSPSEATPAPTPAPAEKLTASSPRTAFREVSLVIRSLRRLGELARKEPRQAADQFASAVAPLADWWCDFDLAQRRAAIDAVVEVIFALGADPDAARTAVGVLREFAAPVAPQPPSTSASSPQPSPSSQDTVLWRTAFAVGMLTRLGNEGDLPRPAGARVSEALNATLGVGRSVEAVSFESGAAVAARLLASSLPVRSSLPATDAPRTRTRVGEFVSICRAISADDPAALERALIDAAERLLIEDAEPDQDASVNAAVSELLMVIKWRKDGPARARLLEWFRDPRFSIADLHVATTTLVNKSAAEGVDQTMALSIGASPDDRVRVRAMIAQAWGMADLESRELAVVELSTQSREVLQKFVNSRPASELDVLAAAAHAAKLCEAARLVWLGDPALARSTIAGAPALIDAATRNLPPPSAGAPPSNAFAPGTGKLTAGGSGMSLPDNSSGDGAWALAYFRAERNIPVRLERLAELASIARPLGKTDASVLVEQAFFGSPAQVRLAAQQWVKKFSSDPAVLEAVLDQLPIAPRVQSVGEVVEIAAQARLPKVSHPQWELAARRELIARLLAALAASGTDSAIDFLAAIIASAYDRPAGPSSQGATNATLPPSRTSPDLAVPARALQGVRREWESWHAEALQVPANPNAPLKLGEVERRRQSRLSVASGPVQNFAAEQLSLAELVSVVVCSERPAEAPRVRQIIDDLTKEKRAARHVFEQVLASQRAMLRLWLIRLGRESDA